MQSSRLLFSIALMCNYFHKAGNAVWDIPPDHDEHAVMRLSLVNMRLAFRVLISMVGYPIPRACIHPVAWLKLLCFFKHHLQKHLVTLILFDANFKLNANEIARPLNCFGGNCNPSQLNSIIFMAIVTLTTQIKHVGYCLRFRA